MTLISALVGVLADRLMTNLHEYRSYERYLRYVAWMRERFSGPAWEHAGGLAVVLLPVWLATGLLQWWIDDWLFGLIDLLFYAGVFVYCLGPRDLAADVDTWCEVAESSDTALRQRAAGRLLRGGEAPENDSDGGLLIARAVLREAADRIFAVLFWFILLGPMGAVAYRSTAVLHFRGDDVAGGESDSGFAAGIARLYAVLLWLPARLLALTFALTGHFDATLDGWRRAHLQRPQAAEGSERVVMLAGSAALGLEDRPPGNLSAPARSAMRLVWRTLSVWLVALSLLVLAGWWD